MQLSWTNWFSGSSPMARSSTAEHISYSDVFPLQPVYPHEQSMSGVFSIVLHWVLQYSPDVVTHEQTGCAHSSAFAGAIPSLLVSDQQRVVQDGILDTGEKSFCPIRNTFQFGSQSDNRKWWKYLGFLERSCRFSQNGCDEIQVAQESLEPLVSEYAG
jgi:hypothetical protein